MKNYCLLVAFLGLFSMSYGQAFNQNYSETKSFIPNKGQFENRDWGKFNEIEFAYTHNPFYIFFSKEGLTYRFDKVIKNPKYKKGDPQSPPKRTNISELVFAEWVGANKNVKIVTEDQTAFHYSYAIKDPRTGNVRNESNIKGFKKITYKNLYDNIDVEYTIHKDGGVKYNIILHPGANPADIQLKYSSNHTSVQHERIDIGLNNLGALAINTSQGAIVEHTPKTFYSNTGEKIQSNYVFDNNTLKFELENFDNTRKVTIDPWIVSPTFNTSTAVWEVETDGAGNVYTIGGETPMELWKYNAAGALQWQYVSPWDTASVWLGTLATDDAGTSFITSGTSPEMERIDNAGNMVWHNTPPGGVFGASSEWWSITFNCDNSKLIVGGTFVPALFSFDYYAAIYDIDPANGNVIDQATFDMVNIGFGFPPPSPVEVRSISSSVNGKYIYLTHNNVGAINQDWTLCGTDEPVYEVDNQDNLGYKCENYLPATQNGGGLKALVANNQYFYTHSGDQLRQWDLNTGALINTVAIPGGVSTTVPLIGGTVVENSGLDVDDCGNVYVGSINQVIKFDPNLNIITTSPTTFAVYDVSVNSNGEILACGAQQDNQATNRNGRIESLNMTACAQFGLVCCDASVCIPNGICASDTPISLTTATPGGTWSGTAVDASGNFDPVAAGPGTHTVTYTLPCGSESITITVNPCAILDVCEESNGNLTVSNGTGPYTWYEGTIAPVTTPITTEQECIDCPAATPQYFIGIYTGCDLSDCSYTDTTWTQFGTGTTVAAPSTYPIYVIDSNGDSTLISLQTDLVPCAGGCTFTVSAALDQNPSTCGAADGSITICGLTASTTYDDLSYNDGSGIISIGSFTSDASGCYTISNLSAGSFTDFSVTLAACTESDPGPVTLSDPGGPTITGITVSDPTCAGACDGSLTANVSGGTAPYTYQWYDGLGNPIGTNNATISGLCADNYSVEVTDAGGGGGTTQLFYDDFETGAAGWTLNVTMAPEGADANYFEVDDDEGGVAPTGCGVANNGDATLHITSVFLPTGGAAYDAGGLCGLLFCPESHRQSETPLINTVGQTNLTLNFDFIANGAIPNDQATVWYNDGLGWTQLGGALQSPICGSGQGEWTAYSQALPASCENIANLQLAIRWDNNDDGAGTDPSVAINNIEVTATSSGGSCTVSQAATLTDPTGLTLSATLVSDLTSCGSSDGIIEVCGMTASTSYTDLSYDNGTGTIALGGITSNGTGCYQITGLPADTYSNFVLTEGACTYSTPGPVTLTDPATVAITASLVSDPTSCIATDGVIQVCGMAASTAYTDLSYDDPIAGTVSLGGITSAPSGCFQITGLAAGSYTNFVLTDGACISSDAGPVALTDPSAITITSSVVSNPTICGGADGIIEVCGMAASTAYTDLSYDDPIAGTVSLGGITSDGSGCYQITGLVAGTYTNFVVTDGGCISTDPGPIALTDPSGFAITTTMVSDPTTCGGTNGVLQVCGMAASTAYTDLSYDDPIAGTVSLGAITSDASGCYQITGLAAGAYSNFVLTDGACSSIDAGPVTLTDPGSFAITASVVSDPTGCSTNDGILQVCGLTPSTTYDDLSYDGPSGTITLGSFTSDGSGCFQITGLAAGTHTNFVVTQGTCTGTDNSSLTLSTVGGPTVSVVASSDVTCNGGNDGSATVEATGGSTPYTYAWSPSGGTGPTANNLTAGTYTVTVTDNTGCTGTETVTINEPTPIVITETVQDENCGASDGSISVSVTGGGASFFTYSWTPGGETTSSITGLNAGSYTVTVTGNNGCTASETYNVAQVGSLPVVATPSVTTINLGESVQLNATGATTYTWNPSTGLDCTDCSDPLATPSTTTSYIVTGTDGSGCSGTDTVLIVVEIVCGDVFVPNIFSPNGVGDPENEQLCVYGNCIRDLRFRIFNRWGQMIFETIDPTATECWDGTFKGKAMMTGTYVYTLYVETFDNEVIEKSGNITLVR